MSTLHLTLHRRWFDEIASGRKTVEYREIKPYWDARLDGRRYDRIVFVNGYGRHRPRMVVECRGITKNSHYNIHLGRIISRANF